MGTRCRNVKHNAVIVGDRELNLKVKIRESLDKRAEDPLESFMAIGQSGRKAVVLIVDPVSSQVAIESSGLPALMTSSISFFVFAVFLSMSVAVSMLGVLSVN